MKMVFSHVFRFLLENISINLRSRFYIIVNYRLNLIYLLAEKERYSWKLFRNIYLLHEANPFRRVKTKRIPWELTVEGLFALCLCRCVWENEQANKYISWQVNTYPSPFPRSFEKGITCVRFRDICFSRRQRAEISA